MTYEQQARIEALRCALSAPYDSGEYVPAHEDTELTQRILDRADVLFSWLMVGKSQEQRGSGWAVMMRERKEYLDDREASAAAQVYCFMPTKEEAIQKAQVMDSPRVQYWAAWR